MILAIIGLAFLMLAYRTAALLVDALFEYIEI